MSMIIAGAAVSVNALSANNRRLYGGLCPLKIRRAEIKNAKRFLEILEDNYDEVTPIYRPKTIYK